MKAISLFKIVFNRTKVPKTLMPILHYRKCNFFGKSSKSWGERELEYLVWREVTEKCFLKILKIEPAVPGLIPSDKWWETDKFYSLPASNTLWRKEINENRTSGENRKLASWFNLDLSLIGFFMTTKLQTGGYCMYTMIGENPFKKIHENSFL